VVIQQLHFGTFDAGLGGSVHPIGIKCKVCLRSYTLTKNVGGFFEQWIKIYNEERPDAALGRLSPIQYLQPTEFSPRGLST